MINFKELMADKDFSPMSKNSFVALTPDNIKKHKVESGKSPNDIHLYQVVASFSGDVIQKSCCGNFDFKSPVSTTGFEEKKENEMREDAAKVGKKMCGMCVSHLYSNKDSSEK